MKRIIGQSIEKKGLFKKEVKDIIEEDTSLFDEIKEIEKSFIHSKGEYSSTGYLIDNQAITNILLWRLNKKLDCLIAKSKTQGGSK